MYKKSRISVMIYSLMYSLVTDFMVYLVFGLKSVSEDQRVYLKYFSSI